MTLQQSVPSPSVVQSTFAATLFDEWCRSGLRDVVVCPGSRSTPLTLACSERDELQLHVRIDERSAGFFALGRALATERPVAIIVTSGTAAAELLAVVAEADLSGVALLIVTADRPPELHGVGAPQTIIHRDLYGSKVRRFEEPGVARLEAASSWRLLANRLWLSAQGSAGRPGPVHLNVALVEPLIADALALPGGRDDGRPWRTVHERSPRLARFDVHNARVLAVLGSGVSRATIDQCVALDWVVLGDATTQNSTPYFDSLLRDEAFAAVVRPELVIRLGGVPASKVLQEQLARWDVRTVAFDGAGPVADPDGRISEVVRGLPSSENATLRADRSYHQLWREASARVGSWLESRFDAERELSEPALARAVVAASARHAIPLVIGSSMPVRDVEWWAPARESPTYANRGANGIDGVVSTVLGVTAGARGLGLIGDVTFLHDVSGLVDGLGEAGGSCVLVVANNQGGGIFSFLAQASALAPERFEQLFATPHSHDLVAVAKAFGHASEMVTTPAQLRTAIDTGVAEPGLSVIVARVRSREENVRHHAELNDAVHQVWRAGAT